MASLKPPFTAETAHEKLKFAQAMWNTQDPGTTYLPTLSRSHSYSYWPKTEKVSKGYTSDCIWRNRDLFIKGSEQIIAFLTAKWEKEKSYRLRKELFTFNGNKIAVQFWYEYQDSHDGMKWKRCYGLEDWTFNDQGKMRKRMMSGNDVLLGKNGDGIAVPEEGIEGRWYVDGVDVEDVEISEKHYWGWGWGECGMMRETKKSVQTP
jgi:uncharacterized protein